jgi:hypothetical protein
MVDNMSNKVHAYKTVSYIPNGNILKSNILTREIARTEFRKIYKWKFKTSEKKYTKENIGIYIYRL